ncbi:MAG: protein kinase [bacterium]|nr:protein kinase [bacterium]
MFRRVVDLEPAARREYLEQACNGDTALRREVEDLLRYSDDPELLGTVGMADWVEHEAVAPELAGYRDLHRIGAGGMGVVYRATQLRPRRDVALKVLRLDAQTDEHQARFERETQFLAQLQHPGIAQVFDVGAFESDLGSVPYFTMELLDGQPIDRYCRDRELDNRARCELVAAVCDAVQHAHERGIVHRDLKPSNVLVVEMSDGRPQPKILDFGVARSIDTAESILQTRTGQLLGTLAYMSPEQSAEGRVDHRADLYAIGVILYEMLAGRLPMGVGGKSLREIQDQLEHEEPPRLGELDTTLRGDLEIIVEKALAKEPDSRYVSTAEFATDLRLFLDDRPIRARRLSAFYYLRKTAMRHRVLLGGVVATMLTLIVGTILALNFAAQERIAREDARRTEIATVGELQQMTSKLLETGQVWDALATHDRIPAHARGWSWEVNATALPRMLHETIDGGPLESHWRFLDDGTMWRGLTGATAADRPLLVRSLHGDTTPQLRFVDAGLDRVFQLHPNGMGTAARGRDAVWVDWRNDTVGATIFTGASAITGVASSVDGRVVIVRERDGAVHVLLDGKPEHSFELVERSSVRCSADGRIVTLRLGDGRAAAIDPRSGTMLLAVSPKPPFQLVSARPFDGGVHVYHFEKRSGPSAVQRADLVDGELVLDDTILPLRPSSMVRQSRDGALIVLPAFTSVRLMDSRTGEPVLLSRLQRPDGELIHPEGFGGWPEISPNGKQLAISVGREPCLLVDLDPRLVEPDHDPRCVVLRGHSSWVYHVAFSHDGDHVVSSAPLDPHVRVWDSRTGAEVARLERGPGRGTSSWDALVAFSADDRRVVFTGPYPGGEGAGVIDWHWQNGEVSTHWPDEELYASNHTRLLDAFVDVLKPEPGERLGHKTAMRENGAITIWRHDATDKPLPRQDRGRRWAAIDQADDGEYAALSAHPDRQHVALIHLASKPALNMQSTHNAIAVLDLETGRVVRRVNTGHRGILCASYSPDGSMLAVGTRAGNLLVLETEHYTTQARLGGHDSYIYSVVWAPDGRRVVTASGDETLRIWNPVRAGR